MKPLRTLLIASLATILFACGNSQQATTSSVNNAPDTNATIGKVEDNSMSSKKMNDNEVEVYWIGLKKKDMKSMYEYVNMSQDQILKYQRGYVDYIDSMQNKNKRLTIDQKDLLKQRDGILYDILKTAQYDKYQEWKKKNSNY
ncbi:hypothetical protein [Aequorivita lipolytica]|uniref:Lipoprotein n=1 Tax=Aequorivita lipolytica TaxID=153267 RepID=A0A5C6YR92_9FLAO|nr:hypothetical protein [Aequorivita lipolytica]TXD69382.1 hypothetical protein ESV24_08470 [Aequorivita lipolytica]SRX53736.1 hypothetical protein AEQU2_02966 [Aequorivita lipolytica]